MPVNGYGPVITVDWFALRRKADREPQHAAGTLPEMRHTYQRNSPRSKGKGGLPEVRGLTIHAPSAMGRWTKRSVRNHDNRPRKLVVVGGLKLLTTRPFK